MYSWAVKTHSANLPKLQFSWGGEGGGWVFLGSQNSKCQDLPKLQFSGGGVYFWVVKTQSAKICLNFNWGGVFLE